MNGLDHESCSRARSWSSLGLDDELSELELRWLHAHLRRCGECRAFERRVRRLTATLREQPRVPLECPIGVPSRRQLELPRAGLRRVASATSAAATVVVVLAAAAVFQSAAVFHSVGTGEGSQPRFAVGADDPPLADDVHVLRREDIMARLDALRAGHISPQRSWLEDP